MEAFLRAIKAVWRPHPGQRSFLMAEAPLRVLASGRRWGKTDAAAIAILARMTTGPPPYRGLIVAPTLDQARILFDRVLELMDLLGPRLGLPIDSLKPLTHPYPSLRLAGLRLDARSGHRPRSLRGREADQIVVDEAAFVDDALITDVLWPMLATTGGSLTLLSTPNGRNAFWRFHRRGEEGAADAWSGVGPSRENPRVSSAFLSAQRELLSERTYRIEYEAEFLDPSGVVFPMPHLLAAAGSPIRIPVEASTYVGVDLGRQEDATAIAVVAGTRSAAEVRRIVTLERADWETQYALIGEIAREWPIRSMTVDATGIGNAPAEELKRRFRPRFLVKPFVFQEASKREIIEALAFAFEREVIRIPHDPSLIEELSAYRRSRSSSGRTRYDGGATHDDRVIALALAYSQLPAPEAACLRAGSDRLL